MKSFFAQPSLEKIFHPKGNRGFTLIETLVAISILLIAVAGPMVVVSQALTTSYYARDQITAFYLAQDAIEYLRNIKDMNISNEQVAFPSDPFDTCLTKCIIDTTVLGVSRINVLTDDDRFLSFNPETGVYSYSGGTPSRFSRSIKIIRSSENPDEYRIDVTMTWKTTATGEGRRTVMLTEYLFAVSSFH